MKKRASRNQCEMGGDSIKPLSKWDKFWGKKPPHKNCWRFGMYEDADFTDKDKVKEIYIQSFAAPQR